MRVSRALRGCPRLPSRLPSPIAVPDCLVPDCLPDCPSPIAAELSPIAKARPEANPFPGRRRLAITIDQTTQVVDVAAFRDTKIQLTGPPHVTLPLDAHRALGKPAGHVAWLRPDRPQMRSNTRIRPDLPAPKGGLDRNGSHSSTLKRRICGSK